MEGAVIDLNSLQGGTPAAADDYTCEALRLFLR